MPSRSPSSTTTLSQQISHRSKRSHDEVNANFEDRGDLPQGRASPSHSGMQLHEDTQEDESYSPPNKRFAGAQQASRGSGCFDLEAIGQMWGQLLPKQQRSLSTTAMTVCL